MAGQIQPDKKALGVDEIKQLQHSKLWKTRYEKYLRKVIHESGTILMKLAEFQSAFKDAADDLGRELFTRKTIEAIENLTSHVGHLQDPLNHDVHQEIPPPDGARHNLPTWASKRLESSLEYFHQLLAHFANGGMNPIRADLLTLRGISEDNVLHLCSISKQCNDAVN